MILRDIHFMFTIVILSLQSYVNSKKDSKLKSATIDAIVEKICNISINSLADKPSEEKSLILTKIENKLKKSAIGAGIEGHKYVKFIMHGIKLIAFNESIRTDSGNDSAISNDDKKDIAILLDDQNNANNSYATIEEKKAKEQAINNIAIKIENLAKKYMKDAETPESKQAVIDTIKKKVMDAANRRHMMIHDKHKEIKSYSNIIAKGIDLMIKKNVVNNTRRKNVEDDTRSHKGVSLKILHAAITPKMSMVAQQIPEKPSCDEILEKICLSTKSLNNITCRYDKNIFPLEKLCNGVSDCYDETDEHDCAGQAIHKIRNAGSIMSEIESAMAQKCITASLDKDILSQQNQILRSVLESQLEFIEKYSHQPIAKIVNHRRKSEDHKKLVKKTAHEVALVVSSLAMALDGSLCSRRFEMDDIDRIAIKYSRDIDADDALNQVMKPALAMASCNCEGMRCANSSCTDICLRVCWQKYALNRWSCRAVDGGPSVPLDSICDGKLDCYDESDEIGCALGSNTKFEASKLYNNVLKLITSKTKLSEYQFVLMKLVVLLDSIKLLQKLSVQPHAETMNLKIVREQCFSSIQSIHESFLKENNVNKLNNGYKFLSSVSEQLINALKRSRTGNDRIISSDKCLCTGNRCAMSRCSKLCVRACSAESNLTRYLCGDMKLSKNIPISQMCNGKPDCPNGEDEERCLKDVCRTHHLIVLQHKLRDVGQKQKGSALGEVLKAWKTKVTSTIMIAEKEGRPSPKEFKDIVSNILQDLVMSYASLNFSRRNNESDVLHQFIKIAQLVMESIKSCGQ